MNIDEVSRTEHLNLERALSEASARRSPDDLVARWVCCVEMLDPDTGKRYVGLVFSEGLEHYDVGAILQEGGEKAEALREEEGW